MRIGKVIYGEARLAWLGKTWSGAARFGLAWINFNKNKEDKMVYEWKSQSRIKTDAQTAGEICEELSATVGLTAENLLNVSRPESAPLHGEFEWNDSIAAERYRLDQARYIIRMICVKKEDRDEDPTPLRAFFQIDQPKYEPLNIIISDSDKKAALLEKAFSELDAFKNKYKALSELTPVFKAIEKVQEEQLLP